MLLLFGGAVSALPARVNATTTVSTPTIVTGVDSPATVAAVATVPTPTIVLTALPATVAGTATVPTPTIEYAVVAATPVAVVSVPTPTIEIRAVPATVVAVATVPTPTGAPAAVPPTVAAVATVPTPTIVLTALPATVNAATSVATPAGALTALPVTVAAVAAVPTPGRSVTALPATVAGTATVPIPVAAGDVLLPAQPAVAAAVSVPTPTIALSALPARVNAVTAVGALAAVYTALPASVAGTASVPTPTIALSAPPARVNAVVSVPTPTIVLTALPATVAAVATVPTPTIALSALPATIAGVAAVGAPTGALTALPATVAGTATVPTPAKEIRALPATVAAVATVPTPTIALSALPARVNAVTAVPTLTIVLTALPARVNAVVSVPTPTIVLTALPATVAGTATVPGGSPLQAVSLVDNDDDVEWGASIEWDARVDLIMGKTVVASTDNGDFVVTAGSMDEDADASIVASARFTILLPVEPGDRHPLTPIRPPDPFDARSGGKLVVSVGHRRPSGARALVQLGVFQIDTVKVTSGSGGDQLGVTALSQEVSIRDAAFWQTERTTAGEKVTDVILRLARQITDVSGAMVDDVSFTAPVMSWAPGDDRLKAMSDVAAGVGLAVRYDRSGRFTIQRRPAYGDVLPAARWTVQEGDGTGTIIELVRDTSDGRLRNGVVVVANPNDSTAGPVSAAVWHTDRTSPLFFDPADPGASVVGPHPEVIKVDTISTVDECRQMARTQLPKFLRTAETIEVKTPSSPEMSIHDVVRVVRPSLGLDNLYVVRRCAHDFLGGDTQLTLVSLGGVTA